ncbi:MAG: hypothetical protein RL001_407, partial [Pseudomonadota bacterium]
TQIQSLSTGQIRALDGDQIVSLTTAQVRGLSATQIKALSAGQISSMEARDLQALAAAQVSSLSTAQIAAITGDQMSALSATQMSGWSAAQKKAFVSPIILDLDGSGLSTISVDNGVSFDIDNDGQVEKTGWIARNTGLLVRDLNEDALINHGGELFGEGTVLRNGARAANGYVALAEMDSNHDGVINLLDQGFGSLKIWQDLDNDGVSDQGELKSLSAHGIAELSLKHQASDLIDQGNLIGLMGSYTTDQGEVRTMGDVWFATDRAGNQTFDLDGLIEKIHATSTSKISLSAEASAGKHLDISLQDVLSVGGDAMAELATTHLMSVEGQEGDSVTLTGTGWSAQGDLQVGADQYAVYVNHNAQVVVNDKVQVQWGSLL